MFNISKYKQALLQSHCITPAQLAAVLKQYEALSGIPFEEFLIKNCIINEEQHKAILKSLGEEGNKMPEKSNLFGHFQILSKIAAGAMGVVYKVVNTKTSEIVALKVLHELDKADAVFLKRFQREMEAASKVVHPNIVAVKEFGNYNNIWFLSMELVEGKTLSQYAPKKVKECVSICLQLCGALSLVHAQGIVHRDIKPDNILMDMSVQPPIPKLSDFSLALMNESRSKKLTQTGHSVGTPLYMSPEQTLGKEVDKRTDIYSLGVVLYELLTEQMPFKARTISELYAKIANESPTSPSLLRRTLNPSLDYIILKAMSKNPDYRYQTCAEMEQDLKKILDGENAKIEKKILWRQMIKDALASRKYIGLGVLVILLIASWSIALLFAFSPERTHIKNSGLEISVLLENECFSVAWENLQKKKNLLSKDDFQKIQQEIRQKLSDPFVQETWLDRIENLYKRNKEKECFKELGVWGQIFPEKSMLSWELFQKLERDSGLWWETIRSLEKLRPAFFLYPKMQKKMPEFFLAVCHLHLCPLKPSHITDAWNFYIKEKKNTWHYFYFQGKTKIYAGALDEGVKDMEIVYKLASKPPLNLAPPLYYLGAKTNYEEMLYAIETRLKDNENSQEKVWLITIGYSLLNNMKNCYDIEILCNAIQLYHLAWSYKSAGAYLSLSSHYFNIKEIPFMQKLLQTAQECGLPDILWEFQKAKLLANKENLEELKKLQKKYPYFEKLYTSAGELCIQDKLYAEAVPYYKSMAEKYPDNLKYHSFLGFLYAIQNQDLLAIQSANKSIDLYEKRPSSLPRSMFASKAYLIKGQILEKQAKTTEALRCYRIALNICPFKEHTQESLKSLYNHYTSRQQYVEIIQEHLFFLDLSSRTFPVPKDIYEKALNQLNELQTKHRGNQRKTASLLADKALILYSEQRLPSAEKMLEDSLQFFPLPRTYLYLGFYYEKQKQLKQAFESYGKALSMPPSVYPEDFPLCYMAYLGQMRCYREDTDLYTQELSDSVEKMIEIYPDYKYHDDFFNCFNYSFLRITDPQRVEKILSFNLSNSRRNNTWAYSALGENYAQAGKTEKAWEIYQRAIDLSPNIYIGYMRFGNFLFRQKKYHQAFLHYSMAKFLGAEEKDAEHIENRLKEIQNLFNEK
ncbi:MAG: protein kinase [Candidatus Brocadiae bacterium]|nr:protein kinase [Candidatus Brocadiia bacterium]